MSRAIHCYLTDDEARRQAEVIALCDEVAEAFSLRALIASIATFLAAAASALVTAFA